MASSAFITAHLSPPRPAMHLRGTQLGNTRKFDSQCGAGAQRQQANQRWAERQRAVKALFDTCSHPCSQSAPLRHHASPKSVARHSRACTALKHRAAAPYTDSGVAHVIVWRYGKGDFARFRANSIRVSISQ
jgi:hypothetical protein